MVNNSTNIKHHSLNTKKGGGNKHARMEKLAENDLTYFYIRHVVIVVTAVTTISLPPVNLLKLEFTGGTPSDVGNAGHGLGQEKWIGSEK
jgi:hypothetical protein